MAPELERYQATMVLALVGDAVGYYGGRWEFRHNTRSIHAELEEMTGGRGMAGLRVQWMVSDDSVMHLATTDALAHTSPSSKRHSGEWVKDLLKQVAVNYKACYNDMAGRAPGKTTGKMCRVLQTDGANWDRIPFNTRGGGSGAAMRAMAIGLRFPDPARLPLLVQVAVETGRMTHHHPTGYLGALTAALFVSYALQGLPVQTWGWRLLTVLPTAEAYVISCGREVKSNETALQEGFFKRTWAEYLTLRGISEEGSEAVPVFPSKYGMDERDKFYRSVSFRGINPGASGQDAVIIAYDALLGAGSSWNELCHRAVLHGGDNDTTGTIATAWWGAIHGFEGVPRCNYEQVEYKGRALGLGKSIHRKACQGNGSRI